MGTLHYFLTNFLLLLNQFQYSNAYIVQTIFFLLFSAGHHHGHIASSVGHLPPKKRARPSMSTIESDNAAKKAPSKKKAKIVRVVSSDSDSSDEESETEEEIDDVEVFL